MIQEFIICDACGEAIKKGQYVYELKLDNGHIIEVHGGKCIDKFQPEIKRVPIHKPDWCISQRSNPLDALEGKDIVIQITVKEGSDKK